jgi:hypothetical protein
MLALGQGLTMTHFKQEQGVIGVQLLPGDQE